MMTICAICGLPFEAKHGWGLCPLCFNSTTAREFEQWEHAVDDARGACLPVQLTFVGWMALCSDFTNKCGYCRVAHIRYIEIVEREKGLVKDNVVPCCGPCHVHKKRGWKTAEQRIQDYFAGKVTFRASSPSVEEDEIMEVFA